MATDHSASRTLPPMAASCHAAGVAGQIPVVVDPSCRDHDPAAEIWIGLTTAPAEVAERVTVIEDSLRELGHPMMPAREYDDTWLTAVHSAELLHYLATVWDRWVAGGYPDLGAERVVPYLFPSAELRQGLPPRIPTAMHAEVGVYCYDTMTLIGPGSWPAIRGATHAARTAVDLVAEGAPSAYALTRPPGHHATRSAYGGSCYLNNAAIAAQSLREADFADVAIIDIDAHHGNGTQAIFYQRADVFTASVHVDPGSSGRLRFLPSPASQPVSSAKPTWCGNQPVPGSGDTLWLAAIEHAAAAAADFGASALVIPLGVDAAIDDPESPLQVSVEGYHRAGEVLGALKLPTVVVQEGGYHLATLGHLVGATLDGLGAHFAS